VRDAPSLADRIAAGAALVKDGATGTELERRGCRSDLPLWSAHALLEAPEVLLAIHADYLEAGAEVLTADTFRTQRRTLARAGLGARAPRLTALAVELARRAAGRAGDRRVFVLGSDPPLEDCYRPDLAPTDPAVLRAEHAEHVRNLLAAGVDAILVETMNTIREALASLTEIRALGAPAIVSFVCDDRGRLLSGEPLRDALAAVAELAPLAAGVNCLPVRAVEACLPALVSSGLRFAVHANLGDPLPGAPGRFRDELDPGAYAAAAQGWVAAGARLVGGCCGTRPGHIRALAALLR
jgi:S-methylmethionine-dependent homocysteine/selenocysteine methylase